MAETVPDKKGKRVIESFGIRTISTTESILNQNSGKILRDEACQQVARFLHISGIPFTCAENPEFIKIFELVA